MRVVRTILLTAAYIGLVCSSALASDWLDAADTSHGICVLLNCDDAAQAINVAEESSFLVHVLTPGDVMAMRDAVVEAGFGIDRVLVEPAATTLPHRANMVDVILALDLSADELAALDLDDLVRVLRPRGKAILSGEKSALKDWAKAYPNVSLEKGDDRTLAILTKPVPKGQGDWTHWQGRTDNNPVSEDTLIKAPYETHWLGGPHYIAMPAITTVAGGRTFLAMGHIAHHRREEPWLNTLLVRDGYNGAELWRKRLPDGYMVHRSAFVASDDAFRMIDTDGAGCLVLDPETGDVIENIDIPEIEGQWKWIAIEGDKLFIMSGIEKDPEETTIVRSKGPHWSWMELSEGYYRPQIPWGYGQTMAAYDLKKHKLLWTHKTDTDIDSRAMVMGDGDVFYYAPESELGRLDGDSGKPIWRSTDEETRALIEKHAVLGGSTPGFRTKNIVVYSPKAMYYHAQGRKYIVAVSPEDGSLLWHREKSTPNPNLVYVEGGEFGDGTVLAGIGKEPPYYGEIMALDPVTGETRKELDFAKRSCARLTATSDSLLCRGWPEGMTRYNRDTGEVTFDGALRPGCNDGSIGANGLLYVGPWLCDCNLSLIGAVALATAQPVTPLPDSERLTTVDATADIKPLTIAEHDWPTYRGNVERSACSAATVPTNIAIGWTWRAKTPYQPTAPVVAGGLVFTGGSDGVVRAINADTGTLAWQYRTGGPILAPPTIWENRALVGSGDGYVYCLEAATGRELWHFLAAPIQRRMMVYGHLASPWPVNTGVLVHNGVAYFGAGIIDYDGTYLYAVDAKTGVLKWATGNVGHIDEHLRKGVSAQGMLTVQGDNLYLAGGNIISPAAFNLETGAFQGGDVGDGSPRVNRGEEIGVLPDGAILLGGRLRYSSMEPVVSPAYFESIKDGAPPMRISTGRTVPTWDMGHLILFPGNDEGPVCYEYPNPGKDNRLWKADALTGNPPIAAVMAANAVVCVNEHKAQRYLTVYPNWEVTLLNPEDGTVLGTAPLPVEEWTGDLAESLFALRPLGEMPLPNGLAVDNQGQIIVTMANGAVACVKQAPPKKE